MEKQEVVLDDGYSYELKFVISPEDYLEKGNQELKKIKRRLRIPGFRPGHVPIHVAKKLVGEQFLYDTVWQIVEEELKKSLDEKKNSLAGEPVIKEARIGEIKWEKGGPAEVVFLIGTKPKIELPDSISEPASFPDIEVSDQYVDEYLEEVSMREGEYVETDDPSEASHFDLRILLDKLEVPVWVARDEMTEDFIKKLVESKGEPVEATIGEDILIEKDKFWERAYDVAKDIEDRQLMKLIDDNRDLANVKVVLEEMQAFKPLKMDLEAIKEKVLIPKYAAKAKDEKEARELLKKQFKENMVHIAYRRAITELLDKLRREIEIPVPEEYLKALAERNLKKEKEQVTEEEISVEADRLKDRLITDLLINAILDKFNIKVSADDVIEALAKYLHDRLAVGEYEELDDEKKNEYKEIAKTFIERGLEREDLWVERVLLEKIVNTLLEKGWLQKKPVPIEEFVK